MSTFTETIVRTFHVVSCYTCGVPFGIDSDLYRRVVTDAKGSVFCPACGKESCWRESEDQRRIKELQRKLEWEAGECARQKAARDAAEASLNATKGVVTRLRNRSFAGVCLCCNRTFANLARHMATKHKDVALSDKK